MKYKWKIRLRGERKSDPINHLDVTDTGKRERERDTPRQPASRLPPRLNVLFNHKILQGLFSSSHKECESNKLTGIRLLGFPFFFLGFFTRKLESSWSAFRSKVNFKSLCYSQSRFEMGILSSILGFCGFGVGTSIGLVIGYYMFIYFQPTDVKVPFSAFQFPSSSLLILHLFGSIIPFIPTLSYLSIMHMLVIELCTNRKNNF